MNNFRCAFGKTASCLTVIMGLFAAGCGSGGDGGTQPGILSVSLTDAPACGYEVVNVTVSKVRVHQSGSASDNAGGWTDITLNPPRPINLLDLNDPTQPNFALEYLGETPLAAGHYTQLRLVLEANHGNQSSAQWIVLEGQDPNIPSNRIPLETPSGIQSGIKLIHEFNVPSGQRVDLLLDFDACHSIVMTGSGKYKLKPVIKVIPYALNGIEGYLDLSLFPNQVNSNHVVVSAQVDGEVLRTTVPNPFTGRFLLGRLVPGTFDVVITARNSPTNSCCATAVISNVPVPSNTSITPISTSSNRFSLQASAFNTIGDTVTLINPPPAPAIDDREDATVMVAAKQTLSGGHIVTVRSQAAMLKDNTATIGDYEYGLILPIAAPEVAPYGPLPIVPSAAGEASVAGVYAVHGSAQTPTTTYATQTPPPSSVNISAGSNLAQDFSLEP